MEIASVGFRRLYLPCHYSSPFVIASVYQSNYFLGRTILRIICFPQFATLVSSGNYNLMHCPLQIALYHIGKYSSTLVLTHLKRRTHDQMGAPAGRKEGERKLGQQWKIDFLPLGFPCPPASAPPGMRKTLGEWDKGHRWGQRMHCVRYRIPRLHPSNISSLHHLLIENGTFNVISSRLFKTLLRCKIC